MCWHKYSKWELTGGYDICNYPIQSRICKKCGKAKVRSIKGTFIIISRNSISVVTEKIKEQQECIE